MARYTESVCKLCRREREKLFLKGARCFTDKCAMERKPYVPGEKGRTRSRETEYLIQLREKQKAKRIYGLQERQFKNYYKKASAQKGITGENLLRLLETRLDSVAYLMGLAASRSEARQLISHGHVRVSDRKVDISSFQVKPGQIIEIDGRSKDMDRIKSALELSSGLEVPEWLEVDRENLKGTVLRYPLREEIKAPVREQLIVELYSK
ncbi:30S ribosomal protein S4 [Candidatus Hakubella thermalkaliphila]|uniref:Small ribosomal subunit protein uS4 n=1 Tax=Candidatus Hakubella thermalkaliphila TaxID=2754717 RepID=A0A6V8P6N8_9ACTN|nr:30S ribosomal protein S4 [Candidatus Hakubella thermalkaliphila]GFP27993.1 small subunit ribosomal protein S4 [Candidatus Hakubella thermalkaliphila]